MIQILKMMFAAAGGLLGDNTPSSGINLSKISYLIQSKQCISSNCSSVITQCGGCVRNISKYAGLGDVALVRWATTNLLSFSPSHVTSANNTYLTDTYRGKTLQFCVLCVVFSHLNENVEMLMPLMLKVQIFSILAVL